MTQQRVLRYEVNADGQPHTIAAGPVLMAHRWRMMVNNDVPAGRIEVWVQVDVPDNFPADGPLPRTRQVIIVGTGHVVPLDTTWLASCLDGPLVWHLYQLGPTT